MSKEHIPIKGRPVGRIEYLGCDGKVGESIEYDDEERMIDDILDDNYYGTPMTVVLYRDETGKTIDQSFVEKLDPPINGFKITDIPGNLTKEISGLKEIGRNVMITFTVSKNGNKAKFRVPCKEEDIRFVQSQLEIPYNTDTRVYIDGVDSEAPELCILEGQNGNLDFMNLLGRLMYGMDCGEFEQFRAGLFVEEPGDIREIINMTQSVDRYSLIKEDDLRESGLDHEMNLRGAIPTAEIEKTNYVAIAQKLLNSDECEDTPYGKVYVNKDHPISDFFDGKHMPAYYDRHCPYAVTLKNENGDEDFMFLPCSQAELMRAASRLNTSFPTDLTYEIDDTEFEDERLGQYMEGADIQTLNEYAELLDNMDSEETEKFIAVVDYCQQYFKGADNPRNILKICKNLDSFSYISGIDNCRDLGDYLISESGDFNYDADLDNYYNYEAFGEDYLGEQAGRFTEHGYVGINDWEMVQHYLSSEAMTMGGM